jgi:4-hydroxy-tetrahydrodipicolinate synthase
MTTLSGVWLPIVTPFHDGAVDFVSYEKLIEITLPPVAPASSRSARPAKARPSTMTKARRSSNARSVSLPGARVFVGIGGNSTAKTLKTLRRLDHFDFAGIVSVCPYYNRPSQDGLHEHFRQIAEATDRQIVIYNIPYRTGVNLANDTLLEFAERPNIVGVKDSSGNLAQSIELLRRRPAGFAVMTGEDNYYYTMLAHGGDGGILASAHLETAAFVAVYERMLANDHRGARRIWSGLETVVPLLFREANPMPIKYCLWRQGLLRSPECRLPLTRVSPELAAELDRAIGYR